jgi:hypothetical protein
MWKKLTGALNSDRKMKVSWSIFNEILVLAIVDQAFQRELLERPLEAVQKKEFPLTEEEKQVLLRIRASDLQTFTCILLEWLL